MNRHQLKGNIFGNKKFRDCVSCAVRLIGKKQPLNIIKDCL